VTQKAEFNVHISLMVAETNAILQALITFVSYLQNLGATINLPDIKMPDELRNVFQYVTKFIDLVLSIIPNMPAFDVRAQLVIMSFLLPFILDAAFVWFVTPFMRVIIQMLDVITAAVTAMVIAASAVDHWTIATQIATVGGILYFLLRIIVILFKRRRKTWNLDELSFHICNFFMAGIIPTVKTTMKKRDLDEAIANFCKYVDIYVDPPSPFFAGAMALMILICLFVSLWSVDTFSLGPEVPPTVKAFVPYLCFPLAALMLAIFALHCIPAGRRALLAIKRFIKRWGLRILMLCLDCLYIPILTAMMPLLTPTNFSCEKGNYLQYDRVPDPVIPDPLFDFVNHTWKCVPCSPIMVAHIEACAAACSGASESRLLESPNLYFVDDVLRVSGGMLLYGIVFVLIGIPALWYIIIQRNRGFVRKVNVYGETVTDKWNAIVHRLETTGIFLFQVYKYPKYWWSILMFAVKFGILLFTVIAGRIFPSIIVLLPLWYLGTLMVFAFNMPYIFKSNNVLSLTLYGVNTLFSIIPICAAFGVEVPAAASVPLAIALLVIPVLMIIALFCFKHGVYDPNDPTLDQKAKDAVGVKEEGTTGSGRSSKAEKEPKEPKEGKDPKGKERRLTHSPSDLKRAATFRGQFRTSVMRDTGGDLGEVINIPEGYIDNIAYTETAERNGLPKGAAFNVGNKAILARATLMYTTLDIVIDGSTIELLAKALNITMVAGAVGFGWYLGGLRGSAMAGAPLNCA
jgi:hypothetical protein